MSLIHDVPTYTASLEPRTYTMRFLRLNCAKNGCEVAHGDDGDMLEVSDTSRTTISGHACDVVTRTITVTDEVA